MAIPHRTDVPRTLSTRSFGLKIFSRGSVQCSRQAVCGDDPSELMLFYRDDVSNSEGTYRLRPPLGHGLPLRPSLPVLLFCDLS